MKKLLVALVLLVSIFIVAGCSNKGANGSKLIGSWEHSGYIYTFNDDKTGNYDAYGTKMDFTYEDNGKTVSILYTDNTDASDYDYKIEGKKLIIKDSFGNDVEYIKK